MLRKNSTGSFSKLSDFWLDGVAPTPGTPGEEQPNINLTHVELSIDAA